MVIAKIVKPEPIEDESVNNLKRFLSFLDKTVEEGKRYHVGFHWKGRGRAGHIICADRTEDGALRLYDPQSGRSFSTPSAILEYGRKVRYKMILPGAVLKIPPRIYRVDDKEFNMEIVEKILKGVE